VLLRRVCGGGRRGGIFSSGRRRWSLLGGGEGGEGAYGRWCVEVGLRVVGVGLVRVDLVGIGLVDEAAIFFFVF
jgi:hypothetical protein